MMQFYKLKVGKICCDCSGFISSLTNKERNSQDYYGNSIIQKSIKERDISMKGLNFGKIHTGLYDRNVGYYTMDKNDRNMVHDI